MSGPGEPRARCGPTDAGDQRPPAPSSSRAVALAPPPEPSGKASNSLIEFSSEAREDPNEGIAFGDTPESCVCPHCDRSVITFIDHEASWVTWLLGFVVWFSLGWMAFWILPLLWPAFKDVVHHCPRCLNVIARKSRISLPTFRSEVMTFKIGGCAVVLARKYVAIMVGLITAILAVYLLRSTVHLNTAPEVQKGVPSMLTWEDFLFDCGPRNSLRHRGSTARTFEERYRRRTFHWQGEVRTIRESVDVLFVRTKSVVMVKMYPPRYPHRDLPDVVLLFGDERNAEVAKLSPGDWVEFEGTMTADGFRGDPEIMTLWHIAGAPRPSPLSSSSGVGNHGRREDKDSDDLEKAMHNAGAAENVTAPEGGAAASHIGGSPTSESAAQAEVKVAAKGPSNTANSTIAALAGGDLAPPEPAGHPKS